MTKNLELQNETNWSKVLDIHLLSPVTEDKLLFTKSYLFCYILVEKWWSQMFQLTTEDLTVGSPEVCSFGRPVVQLISVCSQN